MLTKVIEQAKIDRFARWMGHAERIVIVAHVAPDGDAIGSSLGLWHFLNSQDKVANVIVPNAFPDFLRWMPGSKDVLLYDHYKEFADKLISEAEIICCLDFNALSRIDAMADAVKAAKGKKILIDHHLYPEEFCDITISHPNISSTSELVFRLICRMGYFNEITKAGAEAANYPFCTIEPNVGVVDVPDKRLSVLGEMVKAKKIVPAAMRFVDIAGLVKGASKGEGLGHKFLAHIREVDAVAQVVRCFEDGNITHVEGSIDPLRDIEIINTELCLADMESVEKRQERLVKLLKTGDKKVPIEKAVLDKVLAGLSEAVPARRLGLTEDELEFLKELHLLTMKPVLYVANVSEEEVADASANPHVQAVVKYAAGEGAEVITVSAKMESEIAELPDEEAQEFLAMAGLEEAGLDRLIKAGFKLLGLMTYITAGEIEVRAWTIVRGTKAPQAAGKIHTDFERGFIRAEIVSYNDLVECGSKAAARDKGLVRLEGKEYVMQDGDVVEFRFNV